MTDVPGLCMCWCMRMQHEMHEVCLEGPNVCMAWHWGTKWTICVKDTSNDQNMTSMFNQKETQVLELIRIQYNTKMSLGHSVKHLMCNRVHNLWKMHEHSEKLPQYMLKLPHGANTDTQTSNGTQPNQRFWKIFTETKNPNPIFENPQFPKP